MLLFIFLTEIASATIITDLLIYLLTAIGLSPGDSTHLHT